jgi:hypothetical protein
VKFGVSYQKQSSYLLGEFFRKTQNTETKNQALHGCNLDQWRKSKVNKGIGNKCNLIPL